MRVILDTNVLVSALLYERSLPYQLVTLWRQGRFTLLTSAEQLDELRRVTRYPKIRARLTPALAGRLINDLKSIADMVTNLPDVTVCRDQWDNYLLATIEAGNADILITGDKADLISIGRHAGANIMTVRQFLEMVGRGKPAKE
ncbi:MAG: putative toxin-antitoxin system toxin component, PIN family [Sphingobium sp.]